MGRFAASDIFDRFLPEQVTFKGDADQYAPSNIALSKYWGKRDKELNLPLNSSLSISLREWGTRTKVSYSRSGKDTLSLNGQAVDLNDPFAVKVFAFADHFRRGVPLPLSIDTTNTIPTAAGLASSASGFAALTLSLNQAFGLELSLSTLSMMARIGSGSASRSLWHGFVEWTCGEKVDGTDSYASRLDRDWPEFRIAILKVDTGPKSHPSTQGMNHTVATSPLFSSWPKQAQEDCTTIRDAIFEKDFEKLGETAEANAITMHATMMAARPGIFYLKPQSWSIIDQVQDCRRNGRSLFATMDAGANVKLIFLAEDEQFVRTTFPQAQIVQPFLPL